MSQLPFHSLEVRGTTRRNAQTVQQIERRDQAGLGFDDFPLAQAPRFEPDIVRTRSPFLGDGCVSLGARGAGAAFAQLHRTWEPRGRSGLLVFLGTRRPSQRGFDARPAETPGPLSTTKPA